MKKSAVFSLLFLFCFGLVLGVTTITAEKASAIELCTAGCVYELVCTDFQGPKCTNPNLPYYMWAMNGQCLDGDPEHICLNYFAGCCNK